MGNVRPRYGLSWRGVFSVWYPAPPILAYLRTPADNERGPQYAEYLLADLMQANRRRLPVSLLYTSVTGETVLALDIASSLRAPVIAAIAAHYPGVSVSDLVKTPLPSGEVYQNNLRLVPDVRALRTRGDFEDLLDREHTEPIASFLSAVGDKADGLQSSIRFSLEPCSERRRRRSRRVVATVPSFFKPWLPAWSDHLTMWANGTFLERMFVWPLILLPREALPKDSEQKLDEHLYRVRVQIEVIAPLGKKALAIKRLAKLAGAFAPFTAPGRAQFKRCRRAHRSILSASELAGLWHPPVASAQSAAMQPTDVPNLAAPVELPDCSREEESLPLGITAVGQKRMAGIRCEDRLHSLLIGKSGMGKTTLMATQIARDVQDRGVGVIDPHGDLIVDVLKTIPRHRTNDVIVLDPSDPNSPSVQPLHCDDPKLISLVTENNLASVSKVFGFDERSAPRLLHILRHTLMALVGTEYASYLNVAPMLTDKHFRKKVVNRVANPQVRRFWIEEFGQWSDRYVQESTPAILNKIGQFTTNEHLCRMFGSPDKGIDLRQMMDDGKIVLISLSQGKIGEPAARIAGSFLMSSFQNAAMSRADQQRTERRPFFLYADEYATFVNESFADTLAQARKYGLILTGAQQGISQVEKVEQTIMDAMFGNASTLVSFQVSFKDAERLASEFASGVTPEQLMQLPKYHAIARTAIDGVPSRPFVIKTFPPPVPSKHHADPEKIRRVQQRRYGHVPAAS